MKKYLALLACLLVLMAAQAQDVIIRRNTTTTTTSTTTVTKPKPKPKPRTTQPPSVSSQAFTANGISFKMIRVEGGTFMMGATPEQGSDALDDEKLTHRVTLSSYYIGETEVTQALWEAVMGSNPSNFKGDNRPVEQVSWDDCQTFIHKLNSLTGRSFRLPTEAEWEYAAWGGNKSQGYKYSGSNTLGNVAWYSRNSGDETHPVKGKLPDELGIYDMSGNVWEWTSNCWRVNYSAPEECDKLVIRGGCWYNNYGENRVSCRGWGSAGWHNDGVGFRLAL